MNKSIHLLKIYIGDETKSYLIQMIVNIILLFSIIFTIGEFDYIQQQKKIITELDSSKLVRVDCFYNHNDKTTYMKHLDNYIRSYAHIVSTYMKTLYTKERYNNTRIVIDIKKSNDINEIKLKMAKGRWFNDSWKKVSVFQAIIPKSLSGKYKLGNQYKIEMDQFGDNIDNIQIEIIGILPNDFIYDMSYGDYISLEPSRILIYDKYNKFDEAYYLSNEINSFLIKLDKDTNYNLFYNLMKDYKGIVDITSIEEGFIDQLKKQGPHIILSFVMTINIFVLSLVFIISKNLLIYLNNFEKIYYLIQLGIQYYHFIKLFSIQLLGLVMLPIMISHLASTILTKINLYYYRSYYILYIALIMLLLYCITFTIILMRMKKSIQKGKTNY